MSWLELISSSSPSSVTVISKQSRAEYSSEECSLEVEECDGIVEEPSPPPPPPCVPPEVVCNVEATNNGITPRHSSNRDYSGRRADDTTRLMTKILFPLAVGGVFMVSEMKSFESVSRAGVLIFWVSISLMVLGLNIKFKWLERVGHMLFFIGLMLVCSPIIIGPKHDPRFLWILPLVAALLFGSSVYFGSKNGVQFSSRNIAGTANFATVSGGGAHSEGGERGRWRRERKMEAVRRGCTG